MIAAGAAAWIAIVAALAAAGYAGLPRFAAPAGAIVCVLGGVGITRALAAIDGMRAQDPRRRPAIALAALAVAALVLQGAIRLADVPGELDDARAYAESIDDLRENARALGECAHPTTSGFLAVPPLAWELEVAMSAISVRTETPPAAGTGYEISCPAASGASGSPIARVGGASRYGGSSTSSSSR